MPTIQIVELQRDQAADVWDELVPFVRKALAFDIYSTITLDEIEKQVAGGYARVLICADGERLLAANVVQLFKNAMGERVLHVLATAGDEAHRWLAELIDALNDLAALEGAIAVTMSGRPGWARKLRPYGFRTDNVQMRRPVENEQRREIIKPAAATSH